MILLLFFPIGSTAGEDEDFWLGPECGAAAALVEEPEERGGKKTRMWWQAN